MNGSVIIFKYMKGKHTSLDKELKINILWVEKLREVSKVILGFSNCCRHKYPPGHIRFKQDVDGGIKVNGYSGNGVIDIFIRVNKMSDINAVKDKIADRFILKI